MAQRLNVKEWQALKQKTADCGLDEAQGVEARGLLEAHDGTPEIGPWLQRLGNARHDCRMGGSELVVPTVLRSLSFPQLDRSDTVGKIGVRLEGH